MRSTIVQFRVRGLEDKNGLNEYRNKIPVKCLHPLTQKKIVYKKIKFNFLCHFRVVQINKFHKLSHFLPPTPVPLPFLCEGARCRSGDICFISSSIFSFVSITSVVHQQFPPLPANPQSETLPTPPPPVKIDNAGVMINLKVSEGCYF